MDLGGPVKCPAGIKLSPDIEAYMLYCYRTKLFRKYSFYSLVSLRVGERFQYLEQEVRKKKVERTAGCRKHFGQCKSARFLLLKLLRVQVKDWSGTSEGMSSH